MKKERILSRKFDKLNSLKKALIYRSEDSSERIVEEIKEVTEDLEAILLDLEYIKEEDLEEETFKYRTYKCFRENEKFKIEDVKKYNGKEGKPLYISIDNKVYDIDINLHDREEKNYNEICEYYESNKSLLNKFPIIGVIEE